MAQHVARAQPTSQGLNFQDHLQRITSTNTHSK